MAVKTEIAIRDPLPIYTCGHVIKGAVYIRSPESVVVVEDLLVQLLCKVITRTRPKDGLVAANKHGNHRTVSIPYCFVTRLISQPKHVAANEPFEFEFTIPFETKRNEIEPQWFASALFEQSAGHAIPPTWEDRLGRAKVMHGLEVVMHTANAGGGGSQKTISGREIIFMPCRAVEFPDARCIVVNRMLQAKISRSDIFQNDQLRHKKSFVQLLTPDEKHPVEIQIKVQSPTVLHSGGPVPISISVPLDQYLRHQRPLTPPEDSPPASPILHPAIFVDRMYAYLAVRTYRRIKAGTTEQVLFGDDQIPICNVVDRPVEISSIPIPLNVHYPELRLGPDVVPSFKSFSLQRSFELRIRARLAIGEQQQYVELSTSTIILPGMFRNTAGAIRDVGDRTSLRRRISEETLPPYSEFDPLSEGPGSILLERPPPLII